MTVGFSQNIYQGEISPFDDQQSMPFYSYNTKVHLDSIVYYNAEVKQKTKSVYSFDADGNLLEIKTNYSIESWSRLNGIVIKTRYNINENDTIADTRTTYYKNVLGKDSLVLFEYWDISDWTITYVCVFTYDSNGRELSMSRYWDKECIDPMDKYSYTYDSNGNMLTLVYQSANFGANLINDSKITQSWNADNTLSLQTRYEWDNKSKKWIGTFQYEYYYKEDNSVSVFVNSWRKDWSMWDLYSVIFTYTDSLERQISYVASLLHDDLSSTTLQKTTYDYGEADLPITVHDSVFDETQNTLRPSSSQEFTYDEFNNVLTEKQYNSQNICYLKCCYYYSAQNCTTKIDNAVEYIDAKESEHTTKLLRDGQLLIQREGRMYDLRGQVVK